MPRLATLIRSLTILSVLATISVAIAQEHPAAHDGKPPEGASPSAPGGSAAAKPSISTGSVTSIDGKQTDYTATAGYMPLNDEQGKLRANVFYISYTQGIAENPHPHRGRHRQSRHATR